MPEQAYPGGSVEHQFWCRVEKRSADECWPWIGHRNSQGYGRFYRGEHDTVPAHRLAYELLVGPIADGLVIDHLCRNRACCNPAHMEPVTNGENVRRGIGVTAENARKTHCKHGHEFTPENTYIYPGGTKKGHRECLRCKRRLGQQLRARRRGVALTDNQESS